MNYLLINKQLHILVINRVVIAYGLKNLTELKCEIVHGLKKINL